MAARVVILVRHCVWIVVEEEFVCLNVGVGRKDDEKEGRSSLIGSRRQSLLADGTGESDGGILVI